MFSFFNTFILELLIGAIGFASLIYWYLTRNYDYWTNQDIKGPKPLLLFGNFMDRAKFNIGVNDVRYMKEFGTVYGTFDGTTPVLQVADPELIKIITIKEFHRFNNRRELRTEHPIVNKNLFHSRDERWKRVRTIASSTFSSKKMKNLYVLIQNRIPEYLDHLDQVADNGQDFDIKGFNEKFTLDMIACCAFATQTNSLKDPENPFLVYCRKFFQMKPSRFIPAFIFPKFINNLLGITSSFDPESNKWIIELSKHIIELRKKTANNNKYNDFIQLLMDAKLDDHMEGETNEGLESHFITEKIIGSKNETHFLNKKLTEEEILGQCWVFLVAGYETSSTALTYMSYELAVNPDCQEILYKEISEAMGSDKEISYEKLNGLPYLDACVSETLRKRSPLTRLERECNQDYMLGDSIKLYKGQLVEIPVYAIHNSDKFFENPDQFIPDRFLKENRHKIIPYTFMPFGSGPRHCIGMRFALMEIKLFMAHIILRYRFKKCSKTEENFILLPVTPLLTPTTVTVGIEKR